MTLFLVIWFLVVLIYSLIRVYLYPLYFDLTSAQKIKRGYLKWGENFTYISSVITFKLDSDLRTTESYRYRIDILLKGLYRALFSPLKFEAELKKLNHFITDVNSLNPEKFSKAKKNRKINF